jgi:hypothetical protein
LSVDGALQLLLIIDYIFDWARDIYRPTILKELNILSGADPSDSLSVFHDNDILSMNDGLLSWIRSASMERGFEAKDDSFAQIHSLDTLNGVIRYASKIESRIYGLYLTGDSAATLLQLSQNHIDSQLFAKKIVGAFKIRPLQVTSEMLDILEKLWTGNIQERPGTCPPTTKFLARITFTVYFNARWEQIRELSYLAVSEDGLKVLDSSCYHRGVLISESDEPTEVNIDALEEVIGKLKLASAEQNLAAAVSRLALCLQGEPSFQTRAADQDEQDEPKTKITLVPAQETSPREAKWPLNSYNINPSSTFSREMVHVVYQFIHYIQGVSAPSNQEPMHSFLRVSNHHEEQTLESDKIVPFPLPDSCAVSNKRSIILTGNCSTQEASVYPGLQANVCLSILDGALQILKRKVLRR